MLPVPSVTQLANFSGRPESSYPVAFTPTALRQATLLLTLKTGLSVMPPNADLAELALNAILEMADQIILEQPYQEIKAKPFTSETIMSYSYSKSFQKANRGEDTGLLWWDLAIRKLTVASESDVSSDSISIFENDGVTLDSSGRRQVLGPAGIADTSPLWYSTNSINEVR